MITRVDKEGILGISDTPPEDVMMAGSDIQHA